MEQPSSHQVMAHFQPQSRYSEFSKRWRQDRVGKVSYIAYIYIDFQFQTVDRVLLPLDMFTPKLPAPAPSPAVALAPEKPKKAPIVESPTVPKDLSGAVSSFVQNNWALLVAGTVSAMLSS
ncbi:hypothetical protein GH714_002444 [Hevea brasiliensis]|uniref:Uncharacterized protein n=1 Tax=Hevea brasiliensis TaxID=3981 RepID=A0A6A6K4I2_HEVBR|nr:hypothetical protein GH714_002444 [Hevea brasiliensis]